MGLSENDGYDCNLHSGFIIRKNDDAPAVVEMGSCNLFDKPTSWFESCTNLEMNFNENQTSNCPKTKKKLPNKTNC